ncbi:tRNA pseudouridine(54/55) synthase Pus10 [Halocatena pleomorpha]|uniref:tRNA pseudouridine synthase Pus10 n=1 Tax=Halocatena pleomorpha TaxID=1785090 RepID=A0A3P3RIP0_9EURY|nr:tRNA pseudouridine(54/55) synthase Pus10 [Halocatena pleomorpha]RRJ32808.1 tRNA pseudouridine(54/55) synthase Pus10 [Halocatena pleomorpha]
MDLLGLTRAALDTGPLCDACLGRLVADRGFGLTNSQRGRSLRITVALVDDHPYEPHADEASCWVCEGESARVDSFAERAIAALRGWEIATYQVGTRVPPLLEENDRLLREDVGLDADAGAPLKRELNREVGKRIGAAIDADVDLERPDALVLLDLATDEIELQVNSAFVYGRYRKLKRDVPQTKWPCSDCGQTGMRRGEQCAACDGTGYRYGTSVEQQTAPVLREAMDGSEAVFHGAGREDVDARMLGDGRPFVIEIDEPRTRSVDLDRLETAINEQADAVEVSGLRAATHEMVERVKQLDASKTYRMDVKFDTPIDAAVFQDALDALEGATIEQRTPNRVDHRRADIDRTRTVYDIDGELTDERHATVELHGEGGLYVKELISSDAGRTEPSLTGLLDVDAVVTALDVTGVEGETEPFEQPEYFVSQ